MTQEIRPPVRFEETWCCPNCWHGSGKFMPLDHTRACLISCGYQFPDWACKKPQAESEAMGLLEGGQFDTVEKYDGIISHDLIYSTATKLFYYKGWQVNL